MAEITVPARLDRLAAALDFIRGQMRKAGIDSKRQNRMAIVAEEIFVNIASYAYPAGEGDVTIRIEAGADKVALEFLDGGKPYDPLSHEDPDTSLAAWERDVGGLGIYLVKKMVDRVDYRYEDHKNILYLEKTFDPPEPGHERGRLGL